MRRWKRRFIGGFFGTHAPVEFADVADQAVLSAKSQNKKLLVWAKFAAEVPETDDVSLIRVEDGFLRSRGLGARLVPPLSLVADDLGIYYDPNHPSRLEQLIANAPALPEHARLRTDRLLRRLARSGLSKYNLKSEIFADLPKGHKILVPGQVEDDASVTLGCQDIKTNLDLLVKTRAENPDAIIIYKPHPDVVAGLRTGAVDPSEVRELANFVLENADPVALIDQVDEVWTMTSTLGFEALILPWHAVLRRLGADHRSRRTTDPAHRPP